MEHPAESLPNATAADPALDDLLAEISEKLHAGEAVDLEAYT